MRLFELEERLRGRLDRGQGARRQSKLGHEGDAVGNHAALIAELEELHFDVERDRVINGDREV
jgi:hypothetical protein